MHRSPEPVPTLNIRLDLCGLRSWDVAPVPSALRTSGLSDQEKLVRWISQQLAKLSKSEINSQQRMLLRTTYCMVAVAGARTAVTGLVPENAVHGVDVFSAVYPEH